MAALGTRAQAAGAAGRPLSTNSVRTNDVRDRAVSDVKISTDVRRGHNIYAEGVLQSTTSGINFSGTGVQVSVTGDVTTVNVSTSAGDLVRSTATTLGVATTASPIWESVPGSTLTFRADASNYARLRFNCNVECVSNSACGVAFGYLHNGLFRENETASVFTGIMYVETEGSNISAPHSLAIDHKTEFKVSPGTNTFSLVWASTGAVPVRMGRNMGGCSLSYGEDPEAFAQGGTATVGGLTNLGAQSTLSLQGLACPTLPCQAQLSVAPYDIFVATAPGIPGAWMNTRLGTGP